MRILTIGVLAAAALGCISTAKAADLDYDVLRGAEFEPVAAPVIDWSGVYVGGHGGYSTAALGFKNAFQPIVANLVRATTIEAEMGVSSLLTTHNVRDDGPSFGAFAGYNAQFDDIVLGVEFDYTRFDLGGSSKDAISRSKVTSDGYYNAVDLTGTSSTKIQDYGTIRGRVGYAFGNFLPFVTGGLAIGRARITDSATIASSGYYTLTDKTLPPYSFSLSDGISKVKTVAGAALGAGIEYAITSNILLRGEYQYMLFNDFDGHKVNVNTVRGGAALKF